MSSQGYQLIQSTDNEGLSQACAGIMLETVLTKPDSVLCLASGHSPLGAYRLFVKMVAERRVDISRVVFVKLDEWLGLEMEHPSSCEVYLQKEILSPLRIPSKNYISFCSTAPDPERECTRIAEELNRRGPIDLSLLGVGKNGHLGLNEPCNELPLGPHVAELEVLTKAHPMLQSSAAQVERGYTLGMDDLLASRQAVLLVAGTGKAAAYSDFLKGLVTPRSPVTFLRLHRRLTCIIEKDAVA